MKKLVLFSFLISLFTACAMYQQAKTDSIQLGMNKQEVMGYLKSAYGKAKSSGARILDNGKLEESIDLTEGYDKYTFIFTDGILTEWYMIDVRTTIPPAPIIQTTTSSTETR